MRASEQARLKIDEKVLEINILSYVTTFITDGTSVSRSSWLERKRYLIRLLIHFVYLVVYYCPLSIVRCMFSP